MPGRLDLASLTPLIRKGEIDTVLTVFPDGLARLMGKRMVGRHFRHHPGELGHPPGRRAGAVVLAVHQARAIGADAIPDRARPDRAARHHHSRACCHVLTVLAVLATPRRLRFGSPRL